MDTSYLGDSSQLIYADNKISNTSWYYDGLYLPDGAAEVQDGFVYDTAVTTVEIASLEKQGGVTILSCSEVNGTTGYAELPLLYYPGYTVVQGEGTLFCTANGMVGVAVPAGYTGEISVAYREPKRWLAADLVSLAALVALAGAFGYSRKKKKQ